MSKSATDRAVEDAMAGLAPTEPRPLQTLPIAVYLRPAAVEAICVALVQSADCLLGLAGEEKHRRSRASATMKSLERECRDVADATRAALRATPDMLGLTEAGITLRRDVLARARDVLRPISEHIKTVGYTKARVNVCLTHIATAELLLQKPVIQAAPKPAKPKRRTKSPDAQPKAAAPNKRRRKPPG